MAFSHLDEKNIFKRYDAAKTYTEQLTQPFDEFQRIARNKPFDGIDPNYPDTTDGTTASITRKSPRRVIQQLPTGLVETDDDNDWLPIVAQYIYTNKILPYANEDYDLLQKCWHVTEDGLALGYKGVFTPFLNHDGYFCPDMTEVYWGDLFFQPGKKSGYSCNYLFVRQWWQKEDIQQLIDDQKSVEGSTWDTKALNDVLDAIIEKDAKALTPTEEDRQGEATGIELVIGFQKGIGGKFYTFNPDKKIIVRTKTNKDPRGKMPIDFMYGDVDGATPTGRGIVELIGPLQNLIDSDMQMYQYNRALMLAPPLVKYGNIPTSQVKLVPNAVIDASSDPTAKIVPLTIDTTAVQNYPQLYGLQKSQLLNLVSSPDTSISSDVGNPGFSKTPAGINQQKANLSVDDNYLRKQFEAFFENWSETAINLYFAERSGVEQLQLDDATAEKLRKLITDGKLDPNFISNDNKILIDYDTATPALKFRVDASTSKTEDLQDQLNAWQTFFQAVESVPVLNQFLQMFPEKLLEAYNSIVTSAGVEDPEKIKITKEELDKKLQEQSQNAQASQQVQAQPQKTPSESITFKDAIAAGATDSAATMLEQAGLPANDLRQKSTEQQIASTAQTTQAVNNAQVSAQQAQPSVDEQLTNQLKQLGFSDQAAAQVVTMMNNGMSEQQVLQALGVGNG